MVAASASVSFSGMCAQMTRGGEEIGEAVGSNDRHAISHLEFANFVSHANDAASALGTQGRRARILSERVEHIAEIQATGVDFDFYFVLARRTRTLR